MSDTRSREHADVNHIHPGCECRVVSSPMQAIATALQQGKLPLLTIQTTGSDKLELRVKPYDGNTDYVVVVPQSPDAVASPTNHAIATCQLIRIADRMGKVQVEETHGELCLWLDALCIPAHHHPSADPTSPLFDQQTELYQNAYAVLAMDPEFLLMQPTAGRDEISCHLRAAEWTSYIQTHDKALLNSRVLLMASSGFIDLRTNANSTLLLSALIRL